ncbi:hypothetical protein OE88DRAFT_1637590, partial [Heliocybe sulcata]
MSIILSWLDYAQAVLQQCQLYLDPIFPCDIQSKYAIRNTHTREINGRDHKTKYTRMVCLVQCQCGSDHTDRHQPSKKPQRPWKDVGCGFWVEITSVHLNCISGMPEHCVECAAEVEMIQMPQVPLHPVIWEHALQLLHDGLTIRLVEKECNKKANELFGNSVGDEHACYHLEPYESTSLYRTIVRESGLKQWSKTVENLDRWFRKDDPQPPPGHPNLGDNILYYQPHVEGETDQFILMDSTFGFSSDWLLLFTLVTIDDRNRGIPISYMLFSVRQQTKAVHVDYNGELLSRILQAWKDGMGTNAAGEPFKARIAITDNDLKERRALSETWPDVLLLLCLAHTWRAWGNDLNRYLCIIPKGSERQEVHSHLGKFLWKLCIYYYMHTIHSNISKKQSIGGLAFLAYLVPYIKSQSLWHQWSYTGALEAASTLGIPVGMMPCTTNHLESHNRHLKESYIQAKLHGRQLPQADWWVILLITKVLPDLF